MGPLAFLAFTRMVDRVRATVSSCLTLAGAFHRISNRTLACDNHADQRDSMVSGWRTIATPVKCVHMEAQLAEASHSGGEDCSSLDHWLN